MGTGQKSNRYLVQEAGAALDKFKHEVANEIGVGVPQGGYWGNVPARDCGAVGGNMVKRMIQIAEQQIANNSGNALGLGAANNANANNANNANAANNQNTTTSTGVSYPASPVDANSKGVLGNNNANQQSTTTSAGITYPPSPQKP